MEDCEYFLYDTLGLPAQMLTMIMLVVTVGTGEVESIDVDFNRYIEMFDLDVEIFFFFQS